jgi:serine-type D-Ala-D-Ala carboxypeptidase (penicillin-binding protein 5/6)
MTRWNRFAGCMAVGIALGAGSGAQAAKLAPISKDPYLGAIVVRADSGQVLFEDNADAKGYPASMLKLMNLLLILEKVEQGALKLDAPVKIPVEASKMGGSQVYLDPKETFTVDELVYALVIQSANDAAAALAIHVAGSKEAFVGLMNERAAQLGMKATRFQSVHGLPPGAGQEADTTTARDFAVLCREVAKRPEALRYTSTQERGFRNGTFMLRTHNSLLKTFEGCDGLKTGYFTAAGYSIAATAQRNGVRVIAVILGSTSKQIRDQKAAELLSKGFLAPSPKP